MSEPNGHAGGPKGHVCPQCAAPRALDGTPSCPCGTHASDALRDARTAQAAAAEDFDPLRIRPYVELEGAAERKGTGPGSGAPVGPDGRDGQDGRVGRDGPEGLRATGGEPGQQELPNRSDQPVQPNQPAQPVQPSRHSGDTPTISMPMAAGTSRPDSADVRLFEEPSAPGTGPAAPPPPSDGTGTAADGGARRPRRKRTVLAAAGAVTAVLVTAGFVSGVFSYDTPTRDDALPDDLRASVPDTSPDAEDAPEAAAPSGGTAPDGPSPSGSTAASPGTSPSASASASASAGSAAPSGPADEDDPEPATSAPSPSTATEEPEDEEVPEDEPAPQDLRRGDDGPQVTELQLRLASLGIYRGDIDENFDRGVENAVKHYQFTRGILNDRLGTYGLPTRERLEAETQKP